MKKDTIVLGLGNPLMSDEGIGGFVVEQLKKEAAQYPNVEFVDAGTAGMSLLHLLAGRRKAVIIDCAFMGTEPGTIKKFTPDDVSSVKKLAHQSLHELDILKVIEISKQIGEAPEEIIIFGIEPERIEPGQKISQPLTAKINEYIKDVRNEL